ncbi:MAG: diacylglycerol/lipid kinase family protein [Anaerolineales bacterium]|jgi:YegS/Rv2252/BmrU family lipid kinase
MSLNRIKVIVNPQADFGFAWQGAGALEKTGAEYSGIEWDYTEHPHHADELAYKAGLDGYDMVIAVGGDGTAHEVVNGLMELEPSRRPVLGVIPMGSGNDFAYALGMDPAPEAAFRQVMIGNIKKVDIGLLKDQYGRREYFTNAVGIGFDANVTNYFKKVKYLRGIPAYMAAIIQTLILHHDAPRMQVKTDTEQWEEESLLFVVCNGSREGGGFLIAPSSLPDDGVFHYARVVKISRLMMLRLIPEVMKGTHERFKQVNSGYFQKMELNADRPLHIHTDGEIYAGFESTIEKISIEILPGEIEVSA